MTGRTLELTSRDIRDLQAGTPVTAVDSDGTTVAVFAAFTCVLESPVAVRRLVVSDQELDDLACGGSWTVVDRVDRSYGWTVRMAQVPA